MMARLMIERMIMTINLDPSALVREAVLLARIARIQEECEAMSVKMIEAQRRLLEKEQHWGHDMVDIKACQTALLRDRLSPLLSDAIDALEMEPQAPHVALRRIKSAQLVIRDAVK